MNLSSFCAKRFARRFLRMLIVIIAVDLFAIYRNASPAGALCIPVSASDFCPSEVIIPDSCCNLSINPRKQVCFTGRPLLINTSFPSLPAVKEKNDSSTSLQMDSSAENEALIHTTLNIAISRRAIPNSTITLILPSLSQSTGAKEETPATYLQDEFLDCTIEGLPDNYSLIHENNEDQILFRFAEGNSDTGNGPGEETENAAQNQEENDTGNQAGDKTENNTENITGETANNNSNITEVSSEENTTAEDTVPVLLSLKISIAVNKDWTAYRKAHPEEETARIHTIRTILAAGEDTLTAENAVQIPESAVKRTRNTMSGLYGKVIWNDAGLERKRPDSITFHLFNRDETGVLMPMGNAYDRIVEITGEEQYFFWEDLPSGSYVIKEECPQGYQCKEFTEETKDGNIFVYEHTYENKASLHLIKNWTDPNNVPVLQEGSVSFLLETWQKSISPGSEPVLKNTETIIIQGDHGSFAWDSEDLPIASETSDYFYRLKEITDPEMESGYEITYSLNDRDYSQSEWEASADSLITNGTITVTNRRKPTEWVLPSTGGSGPLTKGLALLCIVSALLWRRKAEGKGK